VQVGPPRAWNATDGLSTIVISDETQEGVLPRLGRLFLAPRLHAANQVMFEDLARAVGPRPVMATQLAESAT